jgi:uncharacterized damage-inducible protein DinB
VERLEIIEGLKNLPITLEREIEGLPEAALRYRPAEGEYSIKETLGHLRDMAEVWHKRLYSIASLTDPRWPGFEGEASVRDHAYQEADVRELIATTRQWRLKTTDLLANTVDWTRLGQSPDLGRRSLKQWAEFVLDHDEDHIAVIRRLKEAQTTARHP